MNTSFKKLLLNTIIASTFVSLTACDNESLSDIEESVEENNSGVVLQSKVLFDPANGVLSVPNDLLFSGTTDGTLNIPVDDSTDITNPSVAINATDGWSTNNPFVLAVELQPGVTLDSASVASPGSVRIYESVMGGSTSSIEACRPLPASVACQIIDELTFGVDFISTVSGSNIAIVPTQPLNPKTTYLVVLTDQILDSNANALAPSDTYTLLKQDLNTAPLGSAEQRGLQGIINSFESAIATQNLNVENIVFSMAMTTQSTLDVLSTLKSLLVQPLAQGGLPSPITVSDTGNTIATVFADHLSNTRGVTLDNELIPLLSTGNVYSGTLQLPYYSGIPSTANTQAALSDRWTALCDSGATLAGLDPSVIPAGPLSITDGVCTALGLRDLSLEITVDAERNLTRFNPVPAETQLSDIDGLNNPGDIDIQMTVPNISDTTTAVRASLGFTSALEEPANGWPIIILQHGITAQKEDILAITGTLSALGFATIAIDLPLHGSRGFDIDGDGIDDVNTTTNAATDYINLGSLLTTRDNLRQSIIDIVGLRFSLNNLSGVNIDTTNVGFLGHSLGAITGISAVALANSELTEGVDATDAFDSLFTINTASFAMPTVGIASSLMESGSFSGLIQSNLTLSLSEDFAGLVSATLGENFTSAQLTSVYNNFLAALNEEQLAALNAGFNSFTFAAQTVIDSGDPLNYLSALTATNTPIHLIEVVGDGATNLSDQVLPNVVSTSPVAGTEAAIRLLGLPGISSTTPGSGAVRFLNGHHSSIIDPTIRENVSPSAELSARATAEMQSQVAGFALSGGQQITITDTAIVQ